MITPDFIIGIISTILVTAGLTWLFYPAWLTAIEEDLEWTEELFNGPQDQEKATLLSVVIPAYNEELRIASMLKCAHTFLASQKGDELIQSLKNCGKKSGYRLAEEIEWIIVDDGSQDGTCKVVNAVLETLNSRNSWRILSLRKNSGKG